MNNKVRACLGAVLLLPLLAQAGGTITLPVTLPTTTASSAKAPGTAPALTATTAAVGSLPLLPAATPTPAATGPADAGTIPLPGLEGLGGGSGLPPLGTTGIRPIRLPVPNAFPPGG